MKKLLSYSLIAIALSGMVPAAATADTTTIETTTTDSTNPTDTTGTLDANNSTTCTADATGTSGGTDSSACPVISSDVATGLEIGGGVVGAAGLIGAGVAIGDQLDKAIDQNAADVALGKATFQYRTTLANSNGSAPSTEVITETQVSAQQAQTTTTDISNSNDPYEIWGLGNEEILSDAEDAFFE